MHNARPVAYVPHDPVAARTFIAFEINGTSPMPKPLEWTRTGKCMEIMCEWKRPRSSGNPRAKEVHWLRWTGWEYLPVPSVPEHRRIRRDI